MTFELEQDPKITMAVNSMVRLSDEIGLTAAELKDAAAIAADKVRCAVPNADAEAPDTKKRSLPDISDAAIDELAQELARKISAVCAGVKARP